jgi:hypothetical protein
MHISLFRECLSGINFILDRILSIKENLAFALAQAKCSCSNL